MKKLFENWRKHLNEVEYEPGRAVADIDTGEEYMSPEDLMRDEVQDLADKFGVEASIEIASDGKPVILVTHRNGETTPYEDTEEMKRDLSDEVGRRDFGDPDKYEDEYEMYEGAVPHSAEHVVNKMRKTGLSAKEALKSLTTNLSDEEAERWLERHKDEMDSHQEMSEGAELKIPVERYDAFKRKIEQWGMLFNKFADHAQDLGHPEHAKAAAPKLLQKVNKLESELRKIMSEFDLNYKSYADERHAALKKLDQFDGDNEYFLENEGDEQ
jgi:hypothetical protein